jgi:hypothetical protein
VEALALGPEIGAARVPLAVLRVETVILLMRLLVAVAARAVWAAVAQTVHLEVARVALVLTLPFQEH